MTTLSLDVRTSTPEELALRMRQDAERWGKVAKEVGIQPQ
jgi:tripartite-type tricarboxylate transporter receptor subunit TctC